MAMALSSLFAFPFSNATAGSIAHNPDAELLALGEQFEAAWGEEQPLWDIINATPTSDDEALFQMAEAKKKVTKDIVHEIETYTATTIEGLRIKARAYFWCRCGDPAERFLEDRPHHATTDIRLAQSIFDDLLGLSDWEPSKSPALF